MQIVVTVEELYSYQGAVWTWMMKRKAFLDRIASGRPLSVLAEPSPPMDWGSAEFLRLSEQWDRENPFPTIIPRV